MNKIVANHGGRVTGSKTKRQLRIQLYKFRKKIRTGGVIRAALQDSHVHHADTNDHAHVIKTHCRNLRNIFVTSTSTDHLTRYTIRAKRTLICTLTSWLASTVRRAKQEIQTKILVARYLIYVVRSSSKIS